MSSRRTTPTDTADRRSRTCSSRQLPNDYDDLSSSQFVNSPRSFALRSVVFWVSMSGIAFLAAVRVASVDPSPWRSVAITAVASGLLFGPFVWVVRDRLSENRRERLGLVMAGIVLLCIPLVLGVGLISGGLLFVLDVSVLGGICGFAVARILERTVVPEHLRETAP